MHKDKKIKLNRINKATFLTKSKKKLEPGGILEQYGQPIQQGLGLAGGITSSLLPEDSIGGGALSGGLQGASAGMAFGPIGAGIGLAAGAGLGALQAKKTKKANQVAKLNRKAAIDQSLMSFKDGGRLLANNLQVINGGELNAISDDAVEVNADNETTTDSVELRDAFVDNNEVIDNENRVYSDSIKYKNGGTIAKEAKRLNKMKAEDRDIRFKDANAHIDSKLDQLFNYQEMKKKKNSNRANPVINEDAPQEMNRGGKIFKYQEGGFLGNTALLNTPPKYNLADYKAGKYKGVAFTTEDYNSLSEQSVALKQKRANMMYDSPNLNSYLDKLLIKSKGPTNTAINKPMRAKGGPIKALGDLEGVMNPNQLTDTGNTTNTFDWQNAASSVATFAPNITNAFLQKQLRGPAAPIQESGANLQRISAEPQLAQASRDFRQAQGVINKGTAQGSDLAAASGSLLAKKFNANNQIYGQTNQLNAQISNQEAFLNQGVKARNTERLNQFRGSQVDFQNKKKQLSSDNIANLSEKVLAKGREKNLMDKDKLALSILGKSYGDSGIYQRNLQNMLQDYMKTKGFKNKGGKINKLYKGGMC